MLSYHIRLAIRKLLQYKTHTLLGLGGLTISLTSIILIVAWTIQELQFDKFHSQAESIYMVTANVSDANGNITQFPETPPPLAQKLKERIPAIKSSCHFIYLYGGRLLNTGNNAYNERGIAVNSNFFEVLDFPLLAGNLEEIENPNTIFISKKLSEKLFQNQVALGKDIVYHNNKVLTVRGILKDVPVNSSLNFDFIVPYKQESENNGNWWQFSGATFIKSTPNENIQDILKTAQSIWKEKFTNEPYKLNLVRLTDLRFHADFDFFNAEHGNAQKLFIFISIAILILILACFNYINLISASTVKQTDQVRIRKLNGANSLNILKSSLTSSVLDSIIAVVLSLFLSFIFVHLFQRVIDVKIDIYYLAISFLFGTVGSIVLIGIISGLYPALATSNTLVFNSGSNLGKTEKSKSIFTNIFVLGQFVLSISLMIVSLIFINQIKYLNNYNTGYNADNILQVFLPPEESNNYYSLKESLLAYPDIENVSMARISPVNVSSMFSSNNWKWDGFVENNQTSIYNLDVDNNYPDIFNLELVSGRFFTNSEAEKNKVVINEALAKLLNFNASTGKTILRGNEHYQIIGVVKNFNFQNLTHKIQPLLFLYHPQQNRMFIRFKGAKDESLAIVQKNFKSFFKTHPFSYSFIKDELDSLYSNEKKLTLGLVVFAIITIFLSCIGLVGQITFNVENRKKEIGIRKVCGAETKEILVLLNKNLIFWFTVACIFSYPISWYTTNKWLQTFAYKTSGNFWLFLLGGFVIVSIALLTVSFQSWKAAIKKPVDTLKYE